MNIFDTGLAIRARRKALGINQRALAEIAGVSMHTVSDIESGKSNPTLDTLTRILDALGLELAIRVRGVARSAS